MKSRINLMLSCGFLAGFMAFSASAKASDWGCKVLLCLANPGSPTEYAECVPPIEKLYSHLAKGGSFPTCSGAGFSSSKPHYDPYECEDGYNLKRVQDASDRTKMTCESTVLTKVSSQHCVLNGGHDGNQTWHKVDGKLVCGFYEQKAPTQREKPNYVDVTIEGSGSRRVWY